MLEGQNIVCFAKDWSEDPTSNNHVMRELARRNRVLWINSIALRTPSLTDKRDLLKMVRKLKSFTRARCRWRSALWVYTPIVVPLPHSTWARAVNRQILKHTIGLLRRRLGLHRFQLWTFMPNIAPLLGTLGESLVVYYCTDEFSQFSYLDGARTATLEQELCRRADVVFTTARTALRAPPAAQPRDPPGPPRRRAPALPPRPRRGHAPRARAGRHAAPVLGFFGSSTTGSTCRCWPSWPSNARAGPSPWWARPAVDLRALQRLPT
jgi:hypothetical protein